MPSFWKRQWARRMNAQGRGKWHWDGSKDYRGHIGERDLLRRVKFWERKYRLVKAATYATIYGNGTDEAVQKAQELRAAAASTLQAARNVYQERLASY